MTGTKRTTTQRPGKSQSTPASTSVLASIGDQGVLNSRLSAELSEVWLDRDLSWLDFNDRVLAEALDQRTPLLERAKFLAIFTANLDEFFMKRVALLREAQTNEERALFLQLREKLLPVLRRQAECYQQALIPDLAKHGILLLTLGRADESPTGRSRHLFRQQHFRRSHASGDRSRTPVPLSLQPLHIARVSPGGP